MIACPVKSSEGGLPKAEFNRVKLMIENIFKHQYVKISEVAIIFKFISTGNQGKRIWLRCSVATACFSEKPTNKKSFNPIFKKHKSFIFDSFTKNQSLTAK